MRKFCDYYATNGDFIWAQKTGNRFRNRIVSSGLSQREVARRAGLYPGHLSELLAGKPRYRWSEDIARRIMKAIKQRK